MLLIAGAAVTGLLVLKLWRADRRLHASKREVGSVLLCVRLLSS